MLMVSSVEDIRRLEAAADRAGLSYATMMQNAGRAVAHHTLELLSKYPDPRVTVLVGPGNNGGDGLVAGYIIARESKALVRFYLLRPRSKDDSNFAMVKNAGLFVAVAEQDEDFNVLRNIIADSDLVLDALYGIGIKLPLHNEAARLLQAVQEVFNDNRGAKEVKRSSVTFSVTEESTGRTKPYVMAVDCPSGLDCDTGALDAASLFADETITFISAKTGLFEFPGAAAVGQLTVANIGIPDAITDLEDEKCFVVDSSIVRQWLPPRPPNANKGTFGKAMIVAGSTNYVGAAGLAALSAYRAGVGLATVGAVRRVVGALSGHLLEITWFLLDGNNGQLSTDDAKAIQPELANYDALLLGPGWGRHESTGDFLTQLLRHGETLPRLVLDADALNTLSEFDEWSTMLPAGTIITPHPGEMARLVRTDVKDVLSDRWSLVINKAKEWKVTLILKGAHTLIASTEGQVAVLPFKTDTLAKAGTGDVLAGIITGLVAQGLPSFHAAVVGGYIHGSAGEQAARCSNHRSVIASDIIESLGEAISQVEDSV